MNKFKVADDKELLNSGNFSSTTFFLFKKPFFSPWLIIFDIMTCFHLTIFFAEGSSTVQRIRNEFAKGLSRKDSTTSSTATETTNMG